MVKVMAFRPETSEKNHDLPTRYNGGCNGFTREVIPTRTAITAVLIKIDV